LNPSSTSARTALLRLALAYVLALLLVATSGAVAVSLGDSPLMTIGAGALGSAASLFLMASVSAVREGRGLQEGLRLARPPPRAVFSTVIGMLALSKALDEAIALLGLSAEGSLKQIRDALEAASGVQRLALLPVLALGSGTAEELFFRGYTLGVLERAVGAGAAVVLSALLFGLFHFDPVHGAAASLMGLFLGYAAIRANSAWPPLFAHVVNNAVATLLPLSADETRSSRVGALVAGLAATAVAVVILARLRPRPVANGG
jgi:membrane protease YdiL (CAAX protease family)